MTTMADFENYRSTFNSHETGGAASNIPLWSKGVSLLNSSLSAFNGISATLRALQQDKANKDQMYKGTMNTMLSNIAVTSSSFGVGSLVAGVAATLLGGSLILPAAIGAAAGLGTAFVIDGTVRRLDPSITR
jgi:hypothetical protein